VPKPYASAADRRGWEALDRELDAWQASGRCATLWWRDDDACSDSPALQRLLAIARRNDVPAAVAAIPATTDATLFDAIAAVEQATIVQHGYAHANHAPQGERAAELGSHRPAAACVDELARGQAELRRRFGNRFAAVLVPPWNRVATGLLPALPPAGLHGLSCFGPRGTATPCAGLVQVNTHVDLIAWKRGRAFIGVDSAIERLVAHLSARRTGGVDAAEATGVLTHHLAFAAAAWEFVDALCARTRGHPAAMWLDVGALFGEAPAFAT
jgi:peptidoglycan/xylan/chitin deacetylase (PgdA/CDA1 family)